MRLKQISVFLENKPGRLVAMLESLEKRKVSIHALSISDTADFGIVRMILADAEEGVEALRKDDFVTRIDWILSTEISDVPGGLLKGVAEPLSKAGINIEYLYAYIEAPSDKAMVALKIDDLEKAEKVLAVL